MKVKLTDVTDTQIEHLRRIIDAGNDTLLLGIVEGCPPEKKCNSDCNCAECIKQFIRESK